ncbi:hypothetical protein D3C87_2095880 [compost metagenome]
MASSKVWTMAPSLRWKRLIWPHGVRQSPKSDASRSEASARAASFWAGVVRSAMYL